MTLFFLFLLLATAAAPQDKPAPDDAAHNPLSVCDILADPLKYNGHLVTIHGVSVGTGEGWWIGPDKTCSRPLTTFAYTWPSTIWVESVGEARPSPDAQFRTDREAISKIDAEVRRMHVDPKLDRIWLNFTGIFQTREFTSKEVSTERGFGFGHMNASPGQLLLKTVSGLHVEHISGQK
jgi:hypothetical protein